jgi:hypothetical protein
MAGEFARQSWVSGHRAVLIGSPEGVGAAAHTITRVRALMFDCEDGDVGNQPPTVGESKVGDVERRAVPLRKAGLGAGLNGILDPRVKRECDLVQAAVAELAGDVVQRRRQGGGAGRSTPAVREGSLDLRGEGRAELDGIAADEREEGPVVGG